MESTPTPMRDVQPTTLQVGLRRLLELLGTVTVYVSLGLFALNWFRVEPYTAVLWPAGGWALAAMLLTGKHQVWGVLVGALLLGVLQNHAPLAVVVLGLGSTLSAYASYHLLRRGGDFDLRLRSVQAYWRLLLEGGVLGGCISTLAVASLHLLDSPLFTWNIPGELFLWWFGHVLGIALLTPLFLVYHRFPWKRLSRRMWLEGTHILGLALLAGQVIFLGWLPQSLGLVVFQGYWMFMLAAWAAIRMGKSGVTVVVCIAATQYMLGMHLGVVPWSSQATTDLVNSWIYLLALSAISMSLAIYLAQRRSNELDLRIAATAFECQEGMIVTDADRYILRTNRSFSRIMGYSNAESAGQPTDFLYSDRHPPDFYANAWSAAQEQGVWSDEVWTRHKNGNVFLQWVTCTAVREESGSITNYVVTHTDISYRKQQEAEQQAAQLAQRDALVREVHHRIKNNLQGITGLLRQFAQAHPETADPINQAIGQVRSIAVIHGLQGRHARRTVRLCELTGAIASDIETLWQVPVRIDLPEPWTPCVVAEREAVPLALILNELIINAVKHGLQKSDGIDIRLRKGAQADHIHIRISNTGDWLVPLPGSGPIRSGLQLVEAMLPRSGAELLREKGDGMIHVLLRLTPPVIHLESPLTLHEPLPDMQNATVAG